MSFDVSRWTAEYRNRNPNEAIPYYDDGIRRTDSYDFESISAHFQRRGYLRRDEFREIGEWKSARQRSRYESNSREDVESVTSTCIGAHPRLRTQVSELRELNGVGVPVASAILTVVFPHDYGVLDFRAWRAAEWIERGTVSFNGYAEYAGFLDEFRNYATVGTYESFLDAVRSLGTTHGASAREIDMALWAYDKYH